MINQVLQTPQSYNIRDILSFKMKTVCTAKTLVSANKTPQCYIPGYKHKTLVPYKVHFSFNFISPKQTRDLFWYESIANFSINSEECLYEYRGNKDECPTHHIIREEHFEKKGSCKKETEIYMNPVFNRCSLQHFKNSMITPYNVKGRTDEEKI